MMIRARDFQKEIQKEITVSLRDLLGDGIALGEVMAVLRETVFKDKGLHVIKRDDLWHVMIDPRKRVIKGPLFKHPSLAACVEFAVKYEEKPV